MKRGSDIAVIVVFIVLATIGLGVTGFGLIALSSHCRRYDDVRRHEAIRLSVDLATAGEYRGVFRQKFIPEHGKQLRLMVEPPFSTSEEMEAALCGLRAHIKIRHPNGTVIREEDVVADRFSEHPESVCSGYAEMPDHTPFLFYDLTAPRFDSCDFVVRVIEPANGLRGRSQTLVSKNVYCRTVSDLTQFFLIGISVVGGLFLLGAACVAGDAPAAIRRKSSVPVKRQDTW